VSSYPEVNATALGHVGDPTDVEIRRAGVATVSYCLANRIPHTEMVDLLQALGVVPGPVSAGKTTPIGRNLTPEVQEQRRKSRAARRAAKRKEAS
jgi:hypothetical protein